MSLTLLEQAMGGRGSPLDVEGRYGGMVQERNAYLDRGRTFSKFTLPYILLDQDGLDRGDAANQHGFQGIGAQVVNHLSNKLTINMFPPTRSFFGAGFDEVTKSKLINDGYDPTALAELLVEAEERVQTYQQKIAARVAYVECFKNLLISGNVCPYLPPDGNLQAIKLDRYAIKRDLSGKMMEFITVQRNAFSALSEDVKLGIQSIKGPATPKPDENVDIYSWVYRKDKKTMYVTQAVLGIMIKPLQEISEEDLPWKPQVWNITYGEDYGRGLVEDHAGDFYVIEFLSEAIAKGMALMADIKYLIKPGSSTDIDEVSQAPIGEWVFGSLDDIGILQLEKYADFSPIAEVLKEYQRRVGQAFLLNSAVRRDAERVTTVELRIDALELETSLGGIYTSLGQAWQEPMARLYLNRVGFPLSGEDIVLNITTGIEAFGKSGDLDKIKQFTEMMQLPQAWPMPVQQRTKWDIYTRQVAAKLSMKLEFIMDDDEWKIELKRLEAIQQQETMSEMAKRGTPEAIKQIGV